MRTTTVLSVLSALLVPAVMAMDASPMFAELFHASKAGPSSRVKIASAYEKVHTQHICLQETRQSNCLFVGCPDLAEVDCVPPERRRETGDCYNCRHHNVYMSELTCCGDQDARGYGDGNSFGAGVDAPTLKVGSCTWDVNLYRQLGDQIDGTPPPAPAPRRNSAPSIAAEQIGTAWATCYLTSGIEYCGEGSLCDNMVLTFKGGVYKTQVRSTLPEGLIAPEQTCLDPKGDSWLVYESTTGRRLAENNSTNTTTPGWAFIMSGPVTLTSLDQPLPYAQGYMDYVAQFLPGGNDRRLVGRRGAARNEGTTPTTEPPILVTPHTYRIKLAARKGKEMYDSAAQ